MEKKATVKARAHHGSKSLDVTIPVAICRDYGINEGDVFYVDVNNKDQEIKIIYTRIFHQK